MVILMCSKGYHLSYKYPSLMNTTIILTYMNIRRGIRIYTHAFGYDFKLLCKGKFDLKMLFYNKNTREA